MSNETLIFHDAQPSHIQAWLLEPFLAYTGERTFGHGMEKGLRGSHNHHVSEPRSTSQNVNVSLCQQLRLPGGAEAPLPGVGSQLGISTW